MEITIEQLEVLLWEQRKIVADNLLNSTSYYNNESTESHSKSMNINKEKFIEIAIKSSLPNEVQILKKYNV